MRTRHKWFMARYAGFCLECRKEILPGDSITRVPEKGYRHYMCPEVLAEKRTPSHDLPIDWERISFPPGTTSKKSRSAPGP